MPDKITVKEKALAIKNYAALSAQHCELIIALMGLAKLHKKAVSNNMETQRQQYREIRNNADLLYKKRISEDKTARTDMMLLRNILVDYNRVCLEAIETLSSLIKDDSLRQLHPFLKHMLTEQKLFLEETYGFNF
ncbi:MAG: hypothetical protein FWG10_02485 [Eubacteriaceae bacterium]|nr:hypothetical protein [Eubacteriaceae bacterium]